MLTPWWLNWTLENTKPSTCPASGPPESRERYKQNLCVCVSLLVCVCTALQTASGYSCVNKWLNVYMWESLWSCTAGQLIRSSAEMSRVTAASDVLTELVYFHLKSNTSCLHLPPHISEYLAISPPSAVPSSLPLHISLVSLQNNSGNKFDHLVAPLQLGAHANTARHLHTPSGCSTAEWGRSIFFFFFVFSLHTPQFFSSESLRDCENINLHIYMFVPSHNKGDMHHIYLRNRHCLGGGRNGCAVLDVTVLVSLPPHPHWLWLWKNLSVQRSPLSSRHIWNTFLWKLSF